jgi:hypothetical protein
VTRAEMIAAVNASNLTVFREEVDHHMGIEDREYAYDEVSALFDIEDRAEDWKHRSLLREARRILIEIGFYRVMPVEEQERTMVSHGTVWAFKQGGTAYTSDHLVCDWQWPVEEVAA